MGHVTEENKDAITTLHNKTVEDYQRRLQRKIKTLYRDHYPFGKFIKTNGLFFCIKTNRQIDTEVMEFLHINGYVRTHLGIFYNTCYYMLDTAPYGCGTEQEIENG